MTAGTNKALITRYMYALRRDKSTETLDAFIADEDLKRHIAMYEASFPGYWIEPLDLLADEDRVFVRGTVRGVQNGALMDMAPSGKEIAVPLFIVYQIADDKIVQHWMLFDMPELLRQLGKAPSRQDAA